MSHIWIFDNLIRSSVFFLRALVEIQKREVPGVELRGFFVDIRWDSAKNTGVTNEEIIKLIASMPSAARREIEDFVALLKVRYAARESPADGFENEGFFGIWRDRDDMEDSTEWVRSVRQRHWAN